MLFTRSFFKGLQDQINSTENYGQVMQTGKLTFTVLYHVLLFTSTLIRYPWLIHTAQNGYFQPSKTNNISKCLLIKHVLQKKQCKGIQTYFPTKTSQWFKIVNFKILLTLTRKFACIAGKQEWKYFLLQTNSS